MKRLFENSCAKGCLVYLVSLVIVVALTTAGLGGLNIRFGLDGQGNSNPSASTPAGSGASASNQPGLTLRNDAQPVQTVAPPTPAPELPAPAPSSGESAPQVVPFQPQDLGITGETLAPFYIVQSGDTLWDIALRFDVNVDALRSANSVADNIIKPGQLLYLPQQGAPAPIPPQAPAQQPTVETQPQPQVPEAPPRSQQPEQTMPTMPHTGIDKEP